jgi:hypothetical protein
MKATTGVTTQDRTWYASGQPTTRKIQQIECILSGMVADYFELQANYTSLLLGHAQNIRSLIYVFIAITTIFIIAVAYLSTHAHRKVSTSHSASSKNSTHQKDVKQQH